MKVTVITVCRNAEREIAETIQSVLSQTFRDYEYILQDGLSDDNTIEVVKKLVQSSTNNNIRIFSGKDNGIYDAMNRAVQNANGEWIVFLNAGDAFYSENVLKDVFDNINDQNDVIYGDANYRDKYGDYIVFGKEIESIGKEMPFCHQSSFTKRELLISDPFDRKYKICADYNFFLTKYREGKKFQHVSIVVSNYNIGGFSDRNRKRMAYEIGKIKEENGYIKNAQIYSSLLAVKYLMGAVAMKVLPDNLVKKLKKR